MTSIEELKCAKSRYVSLKSDANSVLVHLKNCKQMAECCKTTLSSSFVVNEDTVDNNQVSDIGDNVVSMINKLNNEVIPSLNSKICELDRLISQAEAETVAEA